MLHILANITEPTGAIKYLIENVEKLSIITILTILLVIMGVVIFLLFKYFSKQIQERDTTIKEMTSVLLQSNEVITNLIGTIDDNKKDILTELKINNFDIKNHITTTFSGMNKDGNF